MKLKNTLCFTLHALFVFAAGFSGSCLIQARKFELQIDSLWNTRFLLLAIACCFVAYSFWLLVGYSYARVRGKEMGTALQADAYSYAALFPLFCHPYIERDIRIIVFLGICFGSFVALKGIILFISDSGKLPAVVKFSHSNRIGGRLVISSIIFLGAYHLHQVSLTSYTIAVQNMQPMVIDGEARKCLMLPGSGSVKCKLRYPESGTLTFAYGFTGRMIAKKGPGTPRSLSIIVADPDSHKKESFSVPLEFLAGWHDVRIKVKDVPVGGNPGSNVLVRVGTSKLLSWLWTNPTVNSIALTDIIAVKDSDARSPSIILITVDALRPDHIHSYGYHRSLTPATDLLIDDSVSFSHAVTAATWTIPSNMALQTSMYPQRIPQSFAWGVIGESLGCETLTKLFAKNFYVTAAVTDGGWVSSETIFMEGFHVFNENRRVVVKAKDNFDKARKLIEKWKDYPFFIWIYTDQVHNTTFHTDRKLPCDPNDQQGLIDEYDAALESFDDSLGHFIEFLKDSGLYDQTILVLTADHGNAFGESHNDSFYVPCGHNGMPYNEQALIPLIVKPQSGKGFLRGVTLSEYVSNIDIAPTLLDFAGIEKPRQFEGISLLPAIRGEGLPKNRRIYTSENRLGSYSLGLIENGRYKVFYPMSPYPNQRIRIYDLKKDPHERVDMFKSTPDQQKMIAAIEQFLDDCKQLHKGAEKSEPPAMSQELKDQLKGMGYLQ